MCVYIGLKNRPYDVNDVVETMYFCCMCFTTKGGASGHVLKYSFSFRQFYFVVLTFIVALIYLRADNKTNRAVAFVFKRTGVELCERERQ